MLVHHGLFLIIIACSIGLLMAWGVGANGLANIMSTTMGSKAISVKQAMVIAVIFEFAGATIGGVHVTNTIRNGLINLSLFKHHTDILADGMLSTLVAGMVWMWFTSVVGMPVSITNAIIGALLGFGIIELGPHAIHWRMVSMIALTWVFSPIVAGFLSFWLFALIKRTILAASDPCMHARRSMPFFFFLVGVILSIVLVIKDLAVFGYHLGFLWCLLITVLCSLGVTVAGMWLCYRIPWGRDLKRYQRFEYVEKLFGVLMLFTACAMVFAHGSNDVAISVGPIAAILNIVKFHGNGFGVANASPVWILCLGCVGVVIGLFTYGHKVIATVGENITTLTPSRAFAATIASAGTVIIATSSGIPVSATQTLVGGVLGVGLARGIGALNINVVRNIILSWVITIPAAACITIICFRFLSLFH